jgi:hypothetical protein
LCLAYTGLGFDTACGHDEVFQASVLDRVIEPVQQTGLDPSAGRDRDRRAQLSHDRLLALHAGSVEVFGSCRCPYDGVVRDVAVALALSGTVWPV